MKKILIIDDEPDICQTLSELLRDVGYEAVVSYRGIEGFETALRENPDLVILDIALPDLEGTQVYEKMRKTPALQRTKVIFLTALASGAPLQFAGIDREGYTIISKPVQFEILQKEIERQLLVS